MPDKPEIDVQRRRKGEKPTRRAEKPTRREPSQGAPSQGTFGGGSTTGGSSGSGGGFPLQSLMRSGTGKMGCGGILLVGVIIIIFLFIRGGLGDGTTDTQNEPGSGGLSDLFSGASQQEDESAYTAPSRTPWPTVPPSSLTDSDETWLVMTYQDADDNVLEQDIFIDFNEMERIGSTEQVRIVSQIDRFRGGYAADGDWTSARRYLVLQDDNLNRIDSELLMELGEVNMADKETLIDFVTWAMQSYPSDHYVLIMSDHGMGWPGGWSDPDPATRDSGRAPLIGQLKHDSIYLSELDDALAEIQRVTGVEKLDLIGLDACLMSQMEVYSALQPYAHYAVASEETEPGLGWAYSAFLSLLVYDPSIDTAQLATNIVDSYIDQDERIVDDQARLEFLRQNSSTGGFFGVPSISANQLVGQLEQNITLAAVDLEALPNLNSKLNAFVYALQSIDQRIVASARSHAQSYTSIFGRNVPPSYIDLGHFVELIAGNTRDSTVRSTADDVLDAINDVVIAEKHGRSKPGSTGIAIYYPNSSLYQSPTTGVQSYALIADRFFEVSLWDDFLGYHYANRSFSANAAEAVTPTTSSITRAPGGGDIQISQMTISDQTVAPGDYITLSADITGENIGYVYFFTGYYDQGSNSILVADTDYLESADTKSLNGVYYPVWPESQSFRLNFDWEPTWFEITDGDQSSVALFNPITYGASAEDATYAVEGRYTFADTGETLRAEMYFKDGKLFQTFGFQGGDTAASPYEITASPGDSFTILLKWLELDSSGNIVEVVYEEGETLVFANEPFVWEQVYLPEGDYLIGLMVSDLDGQLTQSYIKVQVE